jgi:predicted branched-subunit amino acid permease
VPEARNAYSEGVRAVSPILVGVAPFGLVVGVAAVEAGLGMPEAVGFSVLLFAGASQLAALDLLGRGAPAVVAIVTALVINLRFLMYAASLAPHLADVPLRRRLPAAYLLTDQAFAVSIVRFAADPSYLPRLAFYLGAALGLWVTWQVATVAGVLVGAGLAEALPLDFAVPLVFLALLIPTVVDRPALLAAVVGAGTAVALAPLPANLGMLTGATAGIVAGTAADLVSNR